MNMKERAFVIDKQLQRLFSSNNSQKNNELNHKIKGNDHLLLSMQAVVNAVVYPNTQQSEQTLRIVNTSTQYVNWYKLILSTCTSLYSPVQVAASGPYNEGLSVNRQGRGFSLKILQETSGHEEAYLILSIESANLSQQENGVFMHCMWENQFYVIPFGLPTKSEIQILISTNDKAFNAIAKTESHLYLT